MQGLLEKAQKAGEIRKGSIHVIASRGQRHALKREEHWRATVHVLNLFREGRSMQALRWPNKDVSIDGLDIKKL